MKSILLLTAWLLPFLNTTDTTTACDNLYSKVTYALSHSKKALSATNFEHQMYYAERALTAMKKAEIFINECGCTTAEDDSYFALENLKKAIEPRDWDAGRFFTKKSKGFINELISKLDECTLGTVIEETTIADASTIETLEVQDKVTIERYNSAVETNLATTEKELASLLKALELDNTNSSSTIKVQQQYYKSQAIKVLQKTLDQLKKEN